MRKHKSLVIVYIMIHIYLVKKYLIFIKNLKNLKKLPHPGIEPGPYG